MGDQKPTDPWHSEEFGTRVAQLTAMYIRELGLQPQEAIKQAAKIAHHQYMTGFALTLDMIAKRKLTDQEGN